MKSFFEKLTGATNIEDDMEEIHNNNFEDENEETKEEEESKWMETENEEAQLTLDVYQDNDNIYIRTMVAGIDPDDLDISLSRDMVTIKGSRKETSVIDGDDYFARELYWGSFSRTITLPTEVSIEEAEATEKHGLLTLKLPKTDKGKQTKLKVRSK